MDINDPIGTISGVPEWAGAYTLSLIVRDIVAGTYEKKTYTIHVIDDTTPEKVSSLPGSPFHDEWVVRLSTMVLHPYVAVEIPRTYCPPEAPYLRQWPFHQGSWWRVTEGVQVRTDGPHVDIITMNRRFINISPIAVEGSATNWASDGPRRVQIILHCTDQPWH